MKCPNCNKEITDNVKFCRYCGTNIETPSEEVKCPKCGAQNRQGATFCDSCGTKMSGDETTKDSSVTSSTDSVPEKTINNEGINNENSNKTEETAHKDNVEKFCFVMIVLFLLLICWALLFPHGLN